jgi:hypothetical protein
VHFLGASRSLAGGRVQTGVREVSLFSEGERIAWRTRLSAQSGQYAGASASVSVRDVERHRGALWLCQIPSCRSSPSGNAQPAKEAAKIGPFDPS